MEDWHICWKSQSTNEAFVAVGNGDVIKTRSVVRVMAPTRWSAEGIMNIKGTPLVPRPQNPDESDTFVEEMREPHRGGDDIPLDKDGDQDNTSKATVRTGSKEEVDIGDAGMKLLDSQVRITQKDLDQFGYTDDCPRCQDIIAQKKWKRNHNDDCRLRIYMEYQRCDHPKWRALKHLFSEDTAPKFRASDVDAEGAPATPKAVDGSNIVEPIHEDQKDKVDMDEPKPASSSHNAMDDDFMDPAVLAEAFSDDPTFNMQFDDNEKEDDVAAMFADDDEDEAVFVMLRC